MVPAMQQGTRQGDRDEVGSSDDEAVRTVDGWRLSKVRLTVTHSEHDELRRVAYRKGS